MEENKKVEGEEIKEPAEKKSKKSAAAEKDSTKTTSSLTNSHLEFRHPTLNQKPKQ